MSTPFVLVCLESVLVFQRYVFGFEKDVPIVSGALGHLGISESYSRASKMRIRVSCKTSCKPLFLGQLAKMAFILAYLEVIL